MFKSKARLRSFVLSFVWLFWFKEFSLFEGLPGLITSLFWFVLLEYLIDCKLDCCGLVVQKFYKFLQVLSEIFVINCGCFAEILAGCLVMQIGLISSLKIMSLFSFAMSE